MELQANAYSHAAMWSRLAMTLSVTLKKNLILGGIEISGTIKLSLIGTATMAIFWVFQWWNAA